ncbi:type IV pilus biogenesis/stability protein PilW [Xanthomonas massiliensis]|jgi:type IV pilus assembly protein PilF|uniref:type IV pilus biogenesis/stability protein PilW n=1 Tax=Xanthomonas massiliensis TaxID=1720302 RepID=UPI000826CCA3|nr:type IV pilus biogenesis/stability protein PilW [Xanthomonas massiliensis]
MRRPDPVLIAVVFLLGLCLAGCRSSGVSPKRGKIVKTESVAPRYDVRDNAATKRRMQAQEQLALAVERLRSGDQAQARKLAEEAVRRDPASVDAHTVLAVVLDQSGDSARAGAEYKRATELAPGQGDVSNNYGAWLCANGYPAEALVWFDRSLADPNYRATAAAQANAGGCSLQAGQVERAERDLREALKGDPGNAYALESMARLRYRQERYLEARAFSERRLAAAPATASVLQLAVQIERGLGDKAAAARYQQRLSKEFADSSAVDPGKDR